MQAQNGTRANVRRSVQTRIWRCRVEGTSATESDWGSTGQTGNLVPEDLELSKKPPTVWLYLKGLERYTFIESNYLHQMVPSHYLVLRIADSNQPPALLDDEAGDGCHVPGYVLMRAIVLRHRLINLMVCTLYAHLTHYKEYLCPTFTCVSVPHCQPAGTCIHTGTRSHCDYSCWKYVSV
jgi:hypothetical protein